VPLCRSIANYEVDSPDRPCNTKFYMSDGCGVWQISDGLERLLPKFDSLLLQGKGLPRLNNWELKLVLDGCNLCTWEI